MDKHTVVVILALMLLVILMLTEGIACQWHADDLTHGCRTNWADPPCLHQEKKS